ncbi:unnamed protein product [Somion occarium]|uniref:Uncharacterized protein n=1 Tax=Somion occarium TaxID=3059160 RepID=A0ABP1DSD8_9APHY
MLSFKSLAVAAGVALCAVSSAFAAPTQTFTSEISTTTTTTVDKTTVIKQKSVYVVLSETKYKLEPVIVNFHYLNKVNATVETITPLVNDVKVIITGAVAELHALVGADVSVILATADVNVKVTVQVVAQLVAEILILVFKALAFVLSVVDGAILPTVIALLATVGEVVGALLSIVLSLVGGLLFGLVGAILVLIGEILPIILQLRINILISVLGLKL